MKPETFKYSHLVQFYETDQMGIMHHSNYLRLCEEARVAWAHHYGLIDYQKPESASQFAVLETKVRHLAPLFFGDQVEILVQAKRTGAKIIFQYLLQTRNLKVAEAQTQHVSMNKNLKPTRLPASLDAILENQPWTETLLSSL